MLTCQELKSKIENNKLEDLTLILKYSDNKFLAYQYIEAICKNKQLEKFFIDDLSEIPSEGFLETNALYILDTEELKTLPNVKNLIVICKKAPEGCECVELPSLQKWQIEDYVKTSLEGLDEIQIKWLCDITNYDIYRLECEIQKIKIFAKPYRKLIFEQLLKENNYKDLNFLTVFNFTNAILKKDVKLIAEILCNLDIVDVEATGSCVLLSRDLKKLIDVQFNPKAKAEDLGLNSKQLWAIKQNVGKFTNEQLIKAFEFINDIDYRIKAGELMLLENTNHLAWNNRLVDYITCHLLSL